MTAVSIGALTVEIGADTSRLKAGSAAAKKELAELDKRFSDFSKTANRIGLAFGAAFAGISLAIRNAVNESEKLRRLSDSSGVGIEALSRLKFAAEESGVEFQTLEKVIGQFGARLTEFATNGNSRGAQALAVMGLSARDAAGNLQSFSNLLPQLADRFASYRAGAERSALATALFGEEAGPQLLKLLSQGSAGLKRLGDESDRLGLTITPRTAEALKKFENATRDLDRATRTAGIAIGEFLSPAISELGRVIDSVFVGRNVAGMLPAQLAAEMARLTAQLDAIPARAAALEAIGNNKGLERLKQTTAGLRAELEAVAGLLGQAQMQAGATADRQGQQTAPGLLDTGAQSKALQAAREELDLYLEKLNGVPALFQNAFTFDTAGYEEAIARVDAATKNSVVTAQQAAAMKLGLQRREQDEILNTASLAADTLTAVFNNSKLAAIASAIINTAVGVTKALSASPPPFNFANAALVAAAGAAQIAAIRSATAKGGGSTAPVSGGSSSSQNDAGAGNQAPSRSLRIEGLDPAAIYSGRALEGLIGSINEFVQDGGYLVSTQNVRI